MTLGATARDRSGTPAGILSGINVLDLSDGLAGGVATLFLAESGADVVKVEPLRGDRTRRCSGFATWNRSKQGFALDLLQPRDRGRLDALLDAADVLVHSWPEAEAARRGLATADLLRDLPRLVLCRIPSYPAGHPRERDVVPDPIAMAELGFFDEQQGAGDGPVFLRFPIASWGAAYLAAIGVLARLVDRRRTGRGGDASTSILQGALSQAMLVWVRAEHPTAGFHGSMPKDQLPSIFRCADDVWIHVPYTSPDEVPLMRRGLEEMGEEGVERENSHFPTAHWAIPNFGANRRIFLRHDSATWLSALWDADIPAQPVQPLGEIFRDEQALANGYAVDVPHGTGTARQAAVPVQVTPPVRVVCPAPPLRRHHRVEFSSHRTELPPITAARPTGGPLRGLRVVDCGQFIAGPFGPMLLADLGADVVKVEAVRGDPIRHVEKPFVGCQRGKRSLAVDLKHPEGREVLERLIATADVVHHNQRLRAARRLGLDPDVLLARHPRLVYCHVSAYGHSGPRADWPGYDALFQAAAGWEFEGAGPDNPPMWHRLGVLDQLTGMSSVVATLLALSQREATGRGQFVSTSILGTSVLTSSETMLLPDGTVAPYPRLDHEQQGVGPTQRIFTVRDGTVVVVTTDAGQVRALREVVGADGVHDLVRCMQDKAVEELLPRLRGVGVPAGLVDPDGIDHFFDDPGLPEDLRARLRHPIYGLLELPGAFWDLGPDRLDLDRPPPTVGQHTESVLHDVGYGDGEIASLFDRKVAGCG